MTFKCLQIFILCEFLLFASTTKTASKPKETSGSYITVLNSIVPCKNPVLPYTKDPKVFLDMRLNNNIVKGNFSVIGKNKNIQATITDIYYIDGKWQTSFYAKNISCRSQWITMWLHFLGLQYDKKTCAVPEGSYLFEVDYNKLDHIWMPLRDYGRMLRRVVGHNKAETLLCFEFDSDIKPHQN